MLKLNNGASALEYLVPYPSFRVHQKQLHQQQACTLLHKQTYQQGTQPPWAVSYTHLRAHETREDLVCRLLLEKKNSDACIQLCTRLPQFVCLFIQQ